MRAELAAQPRHVAFPGHWWEPRSTDGEAVFEEAVKPAKLEKSHWGYIPKALLDPLLWYWSRLRVNTEKGDEPERYDGKWGYGRLLGYTWLWTSDMQPVFLCRTQGTRTTAPT